MSNSQDTENKGGRGIAFWITVFRGVLLLILGVSLLVIPDKTHKMLFNAMGLFWLTSGLVITRREAHAKGHRLLFVAGILGVLTGLLVLTRDLSRMWLAEVWVKGLLGAVILLTGVLHVTTGFRSGRQALRGPTLLSTLMGVFEVMLGALLILSPTGRELTVYYVAIVWALLGGVLLLGGSLVQWLQGRRQDQLVPAEEPASNSTVTGTSPSAD